MKNRDWYDVLHLVIGFVKPIIILVLLGFIYLQVFQKFGVGIPCIFYKLTGYKCPGCGMTHALREVWNGNFQNAWEYNPLSVTVFPILCIYLLYRFQKEHFGKGDGFYIWEYILLALLFIVVVLFGYVRNKF